MRDNTNTPSSTPTTNPLDTATAQLLDHIGDVEADGIFNFGLLNSITDDDGVFWFHLRGYSNSDDEIHRDDKLYEVRPSGVIRSYSPKGRPDNEWAEYWNIDWGYNPLDQLYFRHGRRWLLGSYFDEPQVEARFNKETGKLTSRYYDQFYPYKRVAVRALYARFDNPFRCTIAGNPDQYDRDTADEYDFD
jgi:hypothetical protein|tara:strand:+ start:3953 stop:4522 length:570 start_codon:yes stop_codon:yes gene_type:complete